MSEFTLKRGLSDIYAAEVTNDDNEQSGGYTTGTPFKLIPAGEMSITVDQGKTNYWFDNTVFATVGREGASEITVTGAGLRAAAIAALNSKDVDATSGAVFDSGHFAEKYYALGCKKYNIDGTFEYVWFNKGSFSIPDESAKTEGEDEDAAGTSLTYTAIPTTHIFTETNKVCKRVILDSSTGNTVDAANWFTMVKTPDNMTGTVSNS